jgi:hypothetical protein
MLGSMGRASSPALGPIHSGRMALGRLRGGCRPVHTMSATDTKVPLPPPECVASAGAMPPQYDSAAVEQQLYEWWEKSGFFQPPPYAPGEKKSYVLPMPPPNVTGGLHMGHAMFVALQDILARFHRMRGRPTLWLPGTDHAGIATQLLVERAINKEGITRYDLGRDAFLDRVWSWKAEKGGYITQQLRRLGASADWTRERFTMDAGLSEAVAEVPPRTDVCLARMHSRTSRRRAHTHERRTHRGERASRRSVRRPPSGSHTTSFNTNRAKGRIFLDIQSIQSPSKPA